MGEGASEPKGCENRRPPRWSGNGNTRWVGLNGSLWGRATSWGGGGGGRQGACPGKVGKKKNSLMLGNGGDCGGRLRLTRKGERARFVGSRVEWGPRKVVESGTGKRGGGTGGCQRGQTGGGTEQTLEGGKVVSRLWTEKPHETKKK